MRFLCPPTMSHERVSRQAKSNIVSRPGVVSVGERHDDGGTIVVITVERGSGLAPADFPASIEGFPVSVEEGDPVRTIKAAATPRHRRSIQMQYRDYRRPVQPGGSTSNLDVGGTGTLGFMFHDNGRPIITSNWHVWDRGNASRGNTIIQPGNDDRSGSPTGLKIGEFSGSLHPAIASMDIAWGDPTVNVSAEVAGIGFPAGSRGAVTFEPVSKSGRTTGVTHGFVDQVGVTVNVSNADYTMHGQVITSAQAESGDSGSPMVSRADGKAVGFVWGSSPEGSVAMPIQAVEEAIGLPIATEGDIDNDTGNGGNGGGDNGDPVADFEIRAVRGLEVTVGTLADDPENDIAEYQWRWGDGTTTRGAISSHTYTSAGTYFIVHTVVDGAGNRDTTSSAISVEPLDGGGDGGNGNGASRSGGGAILLLAGGLAATWYVTRR